VPVAPAVTVIHAALLVDVQAHPVAAVTVIVPVPVEAPTLAEAEAIVGAQGAPAWVTVNVLPPIVSVPVRGLVVGFAATLYVTDPFPLPVAPALMVIQATLLVAVHAQPAAAVTVTVPLPPAAVAFADGAPIVGAHGVPACVTVKVAPAIVSVPVRLVVPAFAATVNVTVPDPVPAAPVLTVIHAALLTAVQVHPVPALTVLLPLPPAAETDCDVGEMVGAHGALNAKVFDRALGALPPGPTADTTDS
jgi:hypothetical protein